MTKIIKGRFYFKQTSNGNLIGEWSNYESEPATESADLLGDYNTSTQFVGTYNSTWQENGVGIFSKLRISNTAPSKKFTLKWDNFEGEAMLCDNILIGDYHSV
jgi:hypothetical protein